MNPPSGEGRSQSNTPIPVGKMDPHNLNQRKNYPSFVVVASKQVPVPAYQRKLSMPPRTGNYNTKGHLLCVRENDRKKLPQVGSILIADGCLSQVLSKQRSKNGLMSVRLYVINTNRQWHHIGPGPSVKACNSL